MQQDKTTRTAATMVYTRLREAILSGELAPGQKLGIDAMRARFAAGATPMREALNRLVSDGLVISRDLRGFYVADLDESELLELYKARAKFFAFLLREAIEHGDGDWEERVIIAYHRLSKTPWSISEEEFKLNPDFAVRLMDFYIALFSGCGSRWLVDFAVRLHQECNRFLWMVLESKIETNEPESMHRSLVDAVIARDADRAVEVSTLLNERLAQTLLRRRDNHAHAKSKAAPRARRRNRAATRSAK
jgi:DNA-binding GntR family transcriptional regulator